MTTESRKQYLQDRMTQLQKSYNRHPTTATWNMMRVISREIEQYNNDNTLDRILNFNNKR
jgi:hypothetical protein